MNRQEIGLALCAQSTFLIRGTAIYPCTRHQTLVEYERGHHRDADNPR